MLSDEIPYLLYTSGKRIKGTKIAIILSINGYGLICRVPTLNNSKRGIYEGGSQWILR